ncbi:MAG: hypothetical protein JXQ72_11675 [Anaerolineae bacterium]|nr:hypothetical protein [Anaerolineae bacterium]
MALDFTLAAFETFCQQIAHMPVFTLIDYLTRTTAPPLPFVVLRFDVDYREVHAVQMARIAERHNLQGSFYFRHRNGNFDLNAIRTIAALDHEVGYHYETLDTCRGNFDAAETLLMEHIGALRAAGLTIRTVAAHGSTPTAPSYQSNLDLFRRRPELFERAGLVGETTLSVDFSRVVRLSEANWHWQRYAQYQPGAKGRKTSLRAAAQDLPHLDTGLYVTFHPQQWFKRPLEMLYYRWRNRLGRTFPRLYQIVRFSQQLKLQREHGRREQQQ